MDSDTLQRIAHQLAAIKLWVWWQAAAVLAVSYIAGYAFYNLYFHPLAAFPGPALARSSLVWRFWHTMRGRSHRAIQEMHQHYGPVFRVSPNELSFASVDSWKYIYGAPAGQRSHLIKGEFYDIYGAGFKTGCIGSERDPRIHAQKKKNLAPAFSTKALQGQDGIVQRCIDDFVDKISTLGGPTGLDVVEWYEMLAFDILGEMAFGEGFGCVEREEHHFWIKLILDHLLEITVVDNLRRFGILAALGKLLLPRLTIQVRNRHSGYSRAKVEEYDVLSDIPWNKNTTMLSIDARRLSRTSARQDFFTNIAGKVKSGEIDKEEMTAHASTLIIAGGETVATCLAAATYYLLKTPHTYEQLKAEIRGRYQSYEDINAASALQLTYLQAVINESLRIHPPGSQGFPRVSPGIDIDGYYVPKGTEVYTSAWTVTHDPQYFQNPDSFVPERWTDPMCTDRKEASQPFSLGLRACIGRNFAYTEMSSILAKVIYKYEMELVNKELDWEGESHCHIMWWKAPIHVVFRERT